MVIRFNEPGRYAAVRETMNEVGRNATVSGSVVRFYRSTISSYFFVGPWSVDLFDFDFSFDAPISVSDLPNP